MPQIGDRTIKLLSWYDNEFGYSNRLLDFAAFMAAARQSAAQGGT